VKRMITTKSLRIFRADARESVDASALVDLERHDILRAEEREQRTDEDVLLFSHHILFDYAVARLLFRRGKDPALLIQMLRDDRALTLMAGPSLTMALNDVWNADPTRGLFWSLSFQIAAESLLPDAAHLNVSMVAAESIATVRDLNPLLTKLSEPGEASPATRAALQHLVGAVLVRFNAGMPLTGPEAGPWMEIVEALSTFKIDLTMFGIRSFLHIAAQDTSKLTEEQRGFLGAAARRVLVTLRPQIEGRGRDSDRDQRGGPEQNPQAA
jgi:hypothetical protein